MHFDPQISCFLSQHSLSNSKPFFFVQLRSGVGMVGAVFGEEDSEGSVPGKMLIPVFKKMG